MSKNKETPAAKKAGKKKKKSTSTVSSTAQLRRELKKTDRQIVKLCNERAALFQQLAKQEGKGSDVAKCLSSSVPAVELLNTKGPLSEETLAAILRELYSGSQALIRTARVAFLGPEFSYSHLASIQQFGQSHVLTPVSTIAAVFELVDAGDADFGVVPIENSTDGRIVDTLEMFVRLPVRICGEIPMPIHHNLLSKSQLADIEEVHSKPQALSQCRDWLAKNLPKARLVPTASTTAAAQVASTRNGLAAIASKQAGVEYGLNLVSAAIEDNKHNLTRFAVIGREPAARTGDDKTSFMFELRHEPGALADMMAICKRNRLNLTWIESYPKQGSPHEYIFFVELLGHQNDVRVKRAVTSFEKKTVKLEILGSYPRRNASA